MEPIKRGTLVYTRVQSVTGREITVRKRRGVFTLYADNQEGQQFSTQLAAMHAADSMAESPPNTNTQPIRT